MKKDIISVIQYYPNYLDILTEYKKQLQTNQAFSSEMVLVLSMENTIAKNSIEMITHAKKLTQMAGLVAKELNLSQSEKLKLKLLARFHDIGKICVPSYILTKLEPLTDEEWSKIKAHSLESFLVLDNIKELKSIAYDALCHHENYDGTGYPNGLKGKEIPLFSRIIRVLDSYEVLIHGRVYQKPVSKEEAINELNRCKNKQYDPEVVDIVVNTLLKEQNIEKN